MAVKKTRHKMPPLYNLLVYRWFHHFFKMPIQSDLYVSLMAGTKSSEKAKRAKERGAPWRRVPAPLPVARMLGVGWGQWTTLRTHSSACSEPSHRHINGPEAWWCFHPTTLKRGGQWGSLDLNLEPKGLYTPRTTATQIRWRWRWDYPASPWPPGKRTAFSHPILYHLSQNYELLLSTYGKLPTVCWFCVSAVILFI